MELDEMEYKMEYHADRKNPRNVKYVKGACAWCGADTWIVYQRARKYLKEGKNWFCSRKCSAVYGAENREIDRTGKENAGFCWDATHTVWSAFWVDEKTGKQKTTTKARWLWEKHNGKPPKGYWVTYIDGNPENCEIENLELIYRGDRMSEVMMGHQHSEEAKRNMSKAHTGKVLSSEHREKISISLQKRWAEGEFDGIHVGENHRLWRGGNTGTYPNEFYRMRKKILRRDGNRCRICGSREKIHVHHIDRDKTNNDKTNLISVCASCHIKIHDVATKTDDPQILAFRSMLDGGMKSLIPS